MTVDVPQSACSRCGTPFTCGVVAGQASCWCIDMPRLEQIDPQATCLCPECLRAALQAQTAQAQAPQPPA